MSRVDRLKSITLLVWLFFIHKYSNQVPNYDSGLGFFHLFSFFKYIFLQKLVKIFQRSFFFKKEVLAFLKRYLSKKMKNFVLYSSHVAWNLSHEANDNILRPLGKEKLRLCHHVGQSQFPFNQKLAIASKCNMHGSRERKMIYQRMVFRDGNIGKSF